MDENTARSARKEPEAEKTSAVLAWMMRDHAVETVRLGDGGGDGNDALDIECRPLMTRRMESLSRDLGDPPAAPGPEASGAEKKFYRDEMAMRQTLMVHCRVLDACSIPNEAGELYVPGRRDRRWIRSWYEFAITRLSSTEIDALFEACERAAMKRASENGSGGTGDGGGKAGG